jgi:hypothetical protein
VRKHVRKYVYELQRSVKKKKENVEIDCEDVRWTNGIMSILILPP